MPLLLNSLGMLDVHRSTIQRNHQVLMDSCDFNLLFPMLLEKRVFSSEMAKKYELGTDRDKKDKLFKGILKRGPDAFAILVSSLRETQQHHLAELLERNGTASVTDESSISFRSHTHPFQLPTNEEICSQDTEQIRQLRSIFCNVNLQTVPLKVTVKKAEHFYDGLGKIPSYPTSSKHRGAVLIINNRTFINNIEPVRQGSEIDVRNLEELFLQMHMEVETHVDKSKQDVIKIIDEFSKKPVLKLMDMVFIFVMSHGDQGERDTSVVCADGHRLETSWIESQFNNTKCIALQKKPKIFIYQVCRGKFQDFGTEKRIQTDSACQNASIRTCDDMLIAHSTMPDNESHRDIFLGSWFIQLICEVFMHHACDTNIEEMLKIVDNKLERLRSENHTMQTSVYTNQGFKNCYLHPGIYMEHGVRKYFE